MSNMSNVQALRVVEGGLSRPKAGHQARSRAARASSPRWLDFMPIALLGLSAGLAGVMQIVSAVAH